MSKNTNRAKFNKAQNGKNYKLLILKELYPPYYEEGYSYRKPNHKRPFNKWLLGYQYRMYRSWKHNRKKQWK